MMALVTGGASSGKSAFAEQLAVALGGELVYLATMRPYGKEGARRVERHRAQRAGKGFGTVECYGDLRDAQAVRRLDGTTVLLEDLGNLVANELFGEDGHARASEAFAGVAALAHGCAHLVVVGNEIGCDGFSYEAETRSYQEELGRIACEVAALSDLVVECVAGVPVAVKAPAGGLFPAGFAWPCTTAALGGRP